MSARVARQRLAQPDPAFSPAPIWWWSGEPLVLDRLVWQLERFADGGVFNLVILNLAPSGPLHGSLADKPPFLSTEWWDIFRGVCAAAQRLGIRLWFYDQIGFSGANLQGILVRQEPAYAGQELATQIVACAEAGTIAFPSGGSPIAAWQVGNDGDRQSLPVVSGMVRSTHAGHHEVQLVYAVARGFDYLSVAACAALRATVHEAFEREAGQFFGSVIVGSFQDEMPSMPTWSADFAASFATHYGYDLVGEIGALYGGNSPRDQQVRIDYQQWRAARAEAAFFRPFYDWHAARGLVCGFDQQSPARMALPVGAVAEYADYMQTHRWYGAPGSDHHGNGKIHSSLAHLYEHPRSWIEAFHSSGWGGTLEETFDWLVPWLRAGLTLYNPHAVYYSTRGGWWEWAPPSTCWRQPYWLHYRVFADAVMRATGILALGTHVCDIAVLFPTTTVQADAPFAGAGASARLAERVFVDITGSMFWNNPKPGVLERDRRDFDMIDDASLARATCHDGALHVAGEVFRCVILPAVTHLQPGAADRLRAYAAAGGLVVAVAGIPAQLADTPGIIAVADAAALPAVLARLPRRVDGPAHVLERRVDGGRLMCITPLVSGSTFAWSGHWNSTPYAYDAQRLPTAVDLTIAGATVVEHWQLTDGTVTQLTPRDGHWHISYQDAPLALLYVPDDGHSTAPLTPAAGEITQVIALDGPWQHHVIPTLDNRWGDFDRPDSGFLMPQTVRFVSDGGEVTQGFGTYGWYQIADAPPAPLTALQPGPDPLATAGWQPLVYSLTKGIHKDTLHWGMLGPKGYVPEEFMAFGQVAAGATVAVRTTFVLDEPVVGALVVAAAAAKHIWLDGVCVSVDSPGYAATIPVQLATGRHLLEFWLTTEQDIQLRGSWALVRDPARFARPNWIMQPDAPRAATHITFSHAFALPVASTGGGLMVVADVPITVLLDGVDIGRQGGFDPYGSTVRVQPYQLPALAAGTHTIAVYALDSGRGVSVLVDGRADTAVGSTRFMSGAGWTSQRGAAPAQPATIRRRQWVDLTYATDPDLYVDMDPGWPLIDRRPHPLPGATWLEDQPADATVVALVPDAYPGLPRSCTLAWRLPAGATACRITTRATATLTVDGTSVPITDGWAQLPLGGGAAALTLQATAGAAGAALLDAPLQYRDAPGPVDLPQSYRALGYHDYSGAMVYTRTIDLPSCDGRWILTCAAVRGTLAVSVNGIALTPRVWSPYAFDVSAALRVGTNELTLTVTNTLAPYIAGHSPSHYTSRHQEESGILGSIRLERSTGCQ